MRICVSGTKSQGKSTFIKSFLDNWSMYETPAKTYREVLEKEKLPHAQLTNKDTQWKILNCMIDNFQSYSKGDKVIYNGSALDNLAYTMWAYSKELGDIDNEFVKKSVTLVRESMAYIDMILLMPITTVSPMKYKDDTDEDIEFYEEIDNIFKALKYDWSINEGSKIFDPRDKPAIIDIFGSEQERVQICKLYIGEDGKLGGGDGEAALVTEEDIREQEMLKAQFGISDNTSKAVQNPKGYQ